MFSHSGYRLEIWLSNNGILRPVCPENAYEQLIVGTNCLMTVRLFISLMWRAYIQIFIKLLYRIITEIRGLPYNM